MGSIDRRLRHLEERVSADAAKREPVSQGTRRELKRYFQAIVDHRREQAGLPVIERPYTEEDRAFDLDTLESIIPAYRRSLGWQSEKAQAFLDDWERQLRENLKENPR